MIYRKESGRKIIPQHLAEVTDENHEKPQGWNSKPGPPTYKAGALNLITAFSVRAISVLGVWINLERIMTFDHIWATMTLDTIVAFPYSLPCPADIIAHDVA
jgi:hypothetical protein